MIDLAYRIKDPSLEVISWSQCHTLASLYHEKKIQDLCTVRMTIAITSWLKSIDQIQDKRQLLPPEALCLNKQQSDQLAHYTLNSQVEDSVSVSNMPNIPLHKEIPKHRTEHLRLWTKSILDSISQSPTNDHKYRISHRCRSMPTTPTSQRTLGSGNLARISIGIPLSIHQTKLDLLHGTDRPSAQSYLDSNAASVAAMINPMSNSQKHQKSKTNVEKINNKRIKHLRYSTTTNPIFHHIIQATQKEAELIAAAKMAVKVIAGAKMISEERAITTATTVAMANVAVAEIATSKIVELIMTHTPVTPDTPVAPIIHVTPTPTPATRTITITITTTTLVSLTIVILAVLIGIFSVYLLPYHEVFRVN